MIEAATLIFHANALITPCSDSGSPAYLVHTELFITITSIAHLLEFGSTTNKVCQLFSSTAVEASGKLPQSAREMSSQASSLKGVFGVSNVVGSAVPGVPGVPSVSGVSSVSSVSNVERTWCSTALYYHYCAVLHSFLDRTLDANALPDLLPTIHMILVWLDSIHSLHSHNHDDHDPLTYSLLLGGLSWKGLITFLNNLFRTRENQHGHARTHSACALRSRASW